VAIELSSNLTALQKRFNPGQPRYIRNFKVRHNPLQGASRNAIGIAGRPLSGCRDRCPQKAACYALTRSWMRTPHATSRLDNAMAFAQSMGFAGCLEKAVVRRH
jgi:hypothetical protein